MLARDASGKPIAGALNVAGGDVLYGRYWGTEVEVPFLHFNVCYYHSIDECLRRGIQRFEPVSRSHDGLVDILQVGRNDADITRDASLAALSGRVRLYEGSGRSADDVVSELWRRFLGAAAAAAAPGAPGGKDVAR